MRFANVDIHLGRNKPPREVPHGARIVREYECAACAANSLRDSDLALSVMAFIGKNLKRGRFEIFHIVVRLSTLEQSIVGGIRQS